MYFGGKECLYYDDRIPMIDIETLFRSFHYCIKKNYGEKHYKEKIQRFSKKTGISLTTKGLLNISTSDEPDEPAHLTELRHDREKQTAPCLNINQGGHKAKQLIVI